MENQRLGSKKEEIKPEEENKILNSKCELLAEQLINIKINHQKQQNWQQN